MTGRYKNKKTSFAPRIPKTPEQQVNKEMLDSSEDVTWRIFRIMAEFVSGFQFIGSYPKTISILGSARLPHEHKYYQDAVVLARRLGKAGFNIATGGGPGVMEAANKGAYDAGVSSIGLNIQLPFEQRINAYVTKGMGFHYFFTRKVMLSAIGDAYVFFPGGYGTLDEFFEIITLIQTKKMEHIPVVLYGEAFWSGLIDWIDGVVYKKFSGIAEGDINLFTIVDRVDDAFAIVSNAKPRVDF